MFQKLVAIEPVSLIESAEAALHRYAKEVMLYRDVPATPDEIVRRAEGADAMLISTTSTISADILSRLPKLRYVGMCCSLYGEESANVDIRYARAHGIAVTGIRDYGDEGVAEYAVSELCAVLHGFGCAPWDGEQRELTGIKAGFVGLGASGRMVADALRYFGADIAYYARAPKPDAEACGMRYLPLCELLARSEVVFTCLNKFVVLLHDAEFEALGSGKMLFNTGLSPSFDREPFKRWLSCERNLFLCDTEGALGDPELLNHPRVRCMRKSAGRTRQAFVRLSEKVLRNIETTLSQIEK